jgi:hypothetical protein
VSKRFLGRGWSFPIEVDAAGKVQYSESEQKVQESVLIILGTARGERVMRPDFGSRLHELVFAPVNSSTKSLIAHYATEALVQWEARIDVLRVGVREEPSSEGKVLVDVEYRVRSTNSIFNLVYPFYLNGGKG